MTRAGIWKQSDARTRRHHGERMAVIEERVDHRILGTEPAKPKTPAAPLAPRAAAFPPGWASTFALSTTIRTARSAGWRYHTTLRCPRQPVRGSGRRARCGRLIKEEMHRPDWPGETWGKSPTTNRRPGRFAERGREDVPGPQRGRRRDKIRLRTLQGAAPGLAGRRDVRGAAVEHHAVLTSRQAEEALVSYSDPGGRERFWRTAARRAAGCIAGGVCTGGGCRPAEPNRRLCRLRIKNEREHDRNIVREMITDDLPCTARCTSANAYARLCSCLSAVLAPRIASARGFLHSLTPVVAGDGFAVHRCPHYRPQSCRRCRRRVRSRASHNSPCNRYRVGAADAAGTGEWPIAALAGASEPRPHRQRYQRCPHSPVRRENL